MVYSYIFLRICCHSKDEKRGCWWGKRQELGTNLSQSLLVKHVGKWLSLGLEDNAFVTPKLWGKHPMWYIHWVIGLTQPKSKTLWLYDHDTSVTSGLLAIVKSNNHNGSDFLGIAPTNLNLKGGGLVSCQIIWNIEGTWWAFKPQHQGRRSGNEPIFSSHLADLSGWSIVFLSRHGKYGMWN